VVRAKWHSRLLYAPRGIIRYIPSIESRGSQTHGFSKRKRFARFNAIYELDRKLLAPDASTLSNILTYDL